MSDMPLINPTKLYKLVWKDDRSVIQEHILNRAITTNIGRDAENHIILFNPKVSKRHAELDWRDEKFLIADRGSSNGTTVNGKIITAPTQLKDGDRIEIGDFVLSYYIFEEKSSEDIKTRPLETFETIEGQAVSELRTQILPGMKEKAPEKDAKTEEEAAPAVSVTLPAELVNISDTPSKDKLIEGEQFMDIPVKEKMVDHLEDAFADLLKSLSNAQSSGNVLKTKGLNIKKALEASMDQLQVVSDEMKNLEAETLKANLSDMLKRLSSTPNDVTLLMELSKDTRLLEKVIRDYSLQAAVIEKILTKLESDLKTYVS
jgi:predicted component of type VI protein secretion system